VVARAIEALSANRANYWGGLCIDWAAASALMVIGFANASSPVAGVATLAIGLLVYSFYEYAFHRWLYHGPASVVQRVHGIHHDTDRLIGAPFFFSLGIAGLSWLVAYCFIDAALATVFAATILGSYVYQSTVHHLLHSHACRRQRMFRRLRRHHAIHHARGDVNFGLTWMVWDQMLGTRYRPRARD
jgi:sterol desaturase/sphingolipid hydroxylase (fatty acid hydroxylase superfamily)